MTLGIGLAMLAPVAGADSLDVVGHLPSGRFLMAEVWTGTVAYIIGGTHGTGGSDQPLSDIVEFDPATGTPTVVASMPTPRYDAEAVWTGEAVLIFGGWDGSQYIDSILRFDPATYTITEEPSTLPTASAHSEAFWDGRDLPAIGCSGGCAYILGGATSAPPPANSATLASIVRYNPTTATMATMGATLPTGRYSMASVFDGESFYLFGGFEFFRNLDEILKFDPAADTLDVLAAKLPHPNISPTAVWGGSVAYIFGGQVEGVNVPTIFRFDPSSGADPESLTQQLPSGRSGSASVWSPSHGAAFIFGGAVGAPNGIDEILRFVPDNTPATPPSAPLNLVATAGPEKREITLAWDPPASDGGSPVTGYNVYRDGVYIQALGNVLAYADHDLGDGETHTYNVSAENAAGVGPLSGDATATTFDTASRPRKLDATADPPNIILSWDPPNEDGGTPVTGYNIYRGTNGNFGSMELQTTVSGTMASDAPGPGKWCYRVTAVNLVEEGSPSNSACAKL